MTSTNSLDKDHQLSSQSTERCVNCGHPRELQRINGNYIVSEIASLLSFEKGFLFTLRELLLRPGLSVRHFIVKDRSRFVKPVIFIIVCSLIYSLLQQLTSFEDGYINYQFDDWSQSATGMIFKWISKNYGYANILMALFIGLWAKLFFRKYAYSYYEIFILLLFTMGVSMLIFALFGIVESITKQPLLDVGVYIAFIYNAWAIGDFFEQRKIVNYLKALLAYVLGFISFIAAATISGLLIDSWLK